MRWLGLSPRPLVHQLLPRENHQSLKKCQAFKHRREALRLPWVRQSVAEVYNMGLGAGMSLTFRLVALLRLLVRLRTRYLIARMRHKSQVAMRWLGLSPRLLVHPLLPRENFQSLR